MNILLFAASASAQTADLPADSTSTLSAASISTAPAAPEVSTAPVSASTTTAALPAFMDQPAEVPRPWVVSDIAVSGNKNVKSSVIRSQIKARKGDLFDRPDLDRDVQSILGLGNFERVAVDISATDKPVPEHYRSLSGSSHTVILTFLVKEKPLLRKINFMGNKKLSRGVLGDATTLKSKDPLDTLKLHEDEGKILEKYHDKGFLDASVETAVVVDTKTLQADITFTVVEGPKSRITLVTIDTVVAFKPKKILKLMTNKRKKVFVEKNLPEDLKKIETFYLNHGYLDVEVGSATVILRDDKTKIFINIPLTEGRSYKFGDSTFSGNIIYTSTQLAKALEYRKSKTFSQEKYEETIRGIQEAYAEKGRLRARVTPSKIYNKETNLMDVHYAISEGNIVHIDHVDLEGNRATKTHVLRRELVVKPGDVFTASRVRRSRERILNLGFIDEVEIGIEGTTDPDKVDVTFDVTEGKPGLLTAGAAYSSVDGFIGTLSMSHLNLFGRAQQAKLEWQFGKRVQDYFLSWKTPWIYNKPTSLGLDVFNTKRIRPFGNSSSAYAEKQRGGSVHLGPRFKDDTVLLNLTYTFSQISITNVEDRFRGPLSEGTSSFSSLTVGLAKDTRDSIWDPTRGSRHALGLQLTGGPLRGDIHFVSPSLSNFWHYHLFSVGDWPFVLTIANRAAYVTQFGETKFVPVNNRYFVGGQDSLRGYAATGEVGFPSGGKVMEIFNIEFGFPLARERRKTIVKLVAFFDAGSSWDRPKDITSRFGSRTRDLKTDAGLGIRFTTPAFPIRLDWGYGFNHRPGEKLYQINFGLGNLF